MEAWPRLASNDTVHVFHSRRMKQNGRISGYDNRRHEMTCDMSQECQRNSKQIREFCPESTRSSHDVKSTSPEAMRFGKPSIQSSISRKIWRPFDWESVNEAEYADVTTKSRLSPRNIAESDNVTSLNFIIPASRESRRPVQKRGRPISRQTTTKQHITFHSSTKNERSKQCLTSGEIPSRNRAMSNQCLNVSSLQNSNIDLLETQPSTVSRKNGIQMKSEPHPNVNNPKSSMPGFGSSEISQEFSVKLSTEQLRSLKKLSKSGTTDSQQSCPRYKPYTHRVQSSDRLSGLPTANRCDICLLTLPTAHSLRVHRRKTHRMKSV